MQFNIKADKSTGLLIQYEPVFIRYVSEYDSNVWVDITKVWETNTSVKVLGTIYHNGIEIDRTESVIPVQRYSYHIRRILEHYRLIYAFKCCTAL